MTTDHMAVAARLQVDQPWRAHAACAGRARVMDPDTYLVRAARTYGWERDLWRPAKQLCQGCPVYSQCQAWALSLPAREDVTGVCGGLTEEERQTARRRRGGRKAAAARTGRSA